MRVRSRRSGRIAVVAGVLLAAGCGAGVSSGQVEPVEQAGQAAAGPDGANGANGAIGAEVPQIEVRPMSAIETTGILLALAFEGYRFEGYSLPVAYRAQEQLSEHRGHAAVAATRELVPRLTIDGYVELALRAEPLDGPSAGELRYPLPASLARAVGEGDEARGRKRVGEYLRQVAAFYRDAGIGGFLKAHAAGYDRAVEEVRFLSPDASLVGAMERYYGERLRSYTIVPALTRPPYGNVGIAIECGGGAGAEDGAPGCRDAYFVMGTTHSVPAGALLAGEAAGFLDAADPEGSRQRTADLVVHEFGHAFVNPYLESREVRAEVERHADLMARVRDRMAPQAYTEWFGVAVEHVLRATEVRVALFAGDTARAERLRQHYVDERAFVYLPWLEAAAETYEREQLDGSGGPRRRFGAYVPRVVEGFGAVDTAAAKVLLGIGAGPERSVTLRVEAPVPEGDTVYVTGSHAALGEWDPGERPLRRGADGTWSGTFRVEQGTRLELKATRGSWETEGADQAGRPLPNTVIRVRGDTTVTLRIQRWRDSG